jgi:hypothetical protein
MSLAHTPNSVHVYRFPFSPLTASVSTQPLPSNGTVTAQTNGAHLRVTRIAALQLEWVGSNTGNEPGLRVDARMPQDRSERFDPYQPLQKEKRTSAGYLPQRRPLPFAFLAGLIALCREGQAKNGREADHEIADD